MAQRKAMLICGLGEAKVRNNDKTDCDIRHRQTESPGSADQFGFESIIKDRINALNDLHHPSLL